MSYHALLPLWFIGVALLFWCMEWANTRLITYLNRRIEKTRHEVLGALVASEMDEIENMRRFSGLNMQCTARLTDPNGRDWTIIVEPRTEESEVKG